MANPNTDLELVRRIRIDFRILPVNGHICYNSNIIFLISSAVENAIGYGPPKTDFQIEQSISPASSGYESDWYFKQQRQLKFGDLGFLFVRDLSFLDHVDGYNWDDKFTRARQFILKDLDLSVFEDCTGGSNKQQLLTFLQPSEDASQLINLISRSTEESPTIVLKGVPCEWFSDKPSMQNLRNFFQTLGKVRDLETSENNVSIQFENREECSKALKKLCSCSLKKNDDSRMVDYEVTLKDMLIPDVSLEVLANKEQCVDHVGQNLSEEDTQDLKLRMTRLEEELKGIRALLGASPAGTSV